jgi:mannose-1-phosphate guanylyltransferase
MVVLPADHFIRNEEALRDTLRSASLAARKGYLITLGIMPSRPETGYGYIEADMDLRGEGPFPVRRFVEKPPLEQALHYLEDGNYFWNSGMFIWRTDTILAEIATNMPDLSNALNEITFTNDVWEVSDLDSQIEIAYGKINSESIDYGVMERSGKVQVLPVEMGWSDVGSWSALPEVVEADSYGMVCVNTNGEISIDSTDCLIYTDGKMVATVGVHDLIIVSTPDALLVCDRERAQDVKKVVEELTRRGSTSLL